MSEDRQHRIALAYTILFFGLVAGLSYWYLSKLDRTVPIVDAAATTNVQIELLKLFQ